MTESIKALIPAAGRGKRLADLIGHGHKELLRIGPLSMIEHCLGMILASGIDRAGVVTRPDKEDLRRVLESFWNRQGPTTGSLTFFTQDPPRGVADAMRLAADFAGDDPLAVIMPDNILLGSEPALAQMLAGYRAAGSNIIGAIPYSPDMAERFGNVGLMSLDSASHGAPARVRSFSPKGPGLLDANAPGPLYKGLFGVIYRPGWAAMIERISPNFQGELDDTDLVKEFIENSELRAVVLTGQGFDLGIPAGLRAAREAWQKLIPNAI